MQRCSRCGRNNPPNYRFCADCHNLIGGEDATRSAEEEYFLENMDATGGPVFRTTDYNYSSRWLLIATISLAALIVLYATIRLAVGRSAATGGPGAAVEETQKDEVKSTEETSPTAAATDREEQTGQDYGGSALPETTAGSEGPGATSVKVQTSRPRKWLETVPGTATERPSPTTALSPSTHYPAQRTSPANGGPSASAGRRSAASSSRAPASSAAPAAASSSAAPAGARRPARSGTAGREEQRFPVYDGEIKLPEPGPKREPAFSGPVIIVKGGQAPTVARPDTTSRTDLGDAGSLRYQEGIADEYIRLGQNSEAARVLEALLKRDITRADRERLQHKLRTCKE